MKRRPLLLVPVLGAVLLALTGCSPPIIGTLGITRTGDGALTVLVRMCSGSADVLILDPINSNPITVGEAEDDSWKSIPLLKVPLSPAVTSARDVALPFEESAIRSDVLYDLWASGDGGNAFSAQFTADDLAVLEPGAILARGWGKVDTAVVAPDEFSSRVIDFCDARG